MMPKYIFYNNIVKNKLKKLSKILIMYLILTIILIE